MRWKNPWFDPLKSHHQIDGFRNLESSLRKPGDVERWRKERKAQGLPHPPSDGYAAFTERWCQKVELKGQDDRLWWLGHATVLLRINGKYLLTDPILSRRASPLSFAGPMRKTPTPIHIHELHQLDAVLISHNHYDHLDHSTIRQISRHFPNTHFFVPLGLKPWFTRRGIHHVTELDWWQSFSWQEMIFTSVPAQHWSMRSFWDRNRSLWCGWIIESSHLRIWFSGDTGYTAGLADIALFKGPLDAALIPIGAYSPRWFMSNHHMDPQQAVKLWQQLGRPFTVPIHWGVFELADESLDMPPQELQTALDDEGEESRLFSPLCIGQSSHLIKIKT